MHVCGGRAIKQWPTERFAETARALVESHGATILLTGAAGDAGLVDEVKRALAGVPGVHSLAGASTC